MGPQAKSHLKDQTSASSEPWPFWMKQYLTGKITFNSTPGLLYDGIYDNIREQAL